ncbi:MAG: plasminogen-binding N-terminal domain-containing protein [Helicobacteraceae bacterium]|nr:plasminogen-binding N-terminal domain-containing protein [Helicobacteraceae bacterium]
MIRTIFLTLSFFAAASAAIEGRVTAADASGVTASVSGAKAGMSAIVIYGYNGGETISARCATISVSQNTARLQCKPFALYDQDSVPTLTLPVRKGDKAVFAPLEKSAIVIAPSVDRLVRAQSKRADLSFLHPDLLAHQLAVADKTEPDAEDFRGFCDRYLAGTIVFAFSDGDYLTDCQTFAPLEILPETAAASGARLTLPFFNRLGLKSDEIRDFDAYYKRLLSKEF